MLRSNLKVISNFWVLTSICSLCRFTSFNTMLCSGLSANLHAAPIFTPADASRGTAQAANIIHGRSCHSKNSRVYLYNQGINHKFEKDFFGSAMVFENGKNSQSHEDRSICNPCAVIIAPIEVIINSLHLQNCDLHYLDVKC